jgi:hypothetical protein
MRIGTVQNEGLDRRTTPWRPKVLRRNRRGRSVPARIDPQRVQARGGMGQGRGLVPGLTEGILILPYEPRTPAEGR